MSPPGHRRIIFYYQYTKYYDIGCMLSLKCKINGVPLTWKLYKHQIWICFIPRSTLTDPRSYTIASHLLFLWFFISPAWWWIVSILCVIGKDSRTHYFQTTPFCFHAVAELHVSWNFFHHLLIFHKNLLDCTDALKHRKRTWLRTF